MNWSRNRIVTVTMLGLIASVGVLPIQAAEKSGVSPYDFEDGLPANWTLKSSVASDKRNTPNAELETNGGNTVLELGKHALMVMGDEDLLNFSLEATVRREYDSSGSQAGFQFRNGYRVYLRKPGRVELTGPGGARGRGFTRNRVTHKPTKLKIVVVGPVVRFFVDGKYEGQFDELEMTPGPVALHQRGLQHNCYFDNVTLDTTIDPSQFLVCAPVTGEDKALVFDPSEDVKLTFTVANHYEADQDSKIGINLSTFDDKPVFNGSSDPTTIRAGETKTVTLNLGRIPAGYYKLTFVATEKIAPLAVHVKGTVTEAQFTMPKLLTGVYWYYFGWQGLPEVWWNTYMHAACNDLREHHFNTIICAIGMPTESIRIAGQYGIRCFTRGLGAGKNVADPNVIGGFLGDEPHKGDEENYLKNYTESINAYPDKIWTTCMIADGGMDGCKDWWNAWMPLSKNDKVVPMFRWYGLKKFHMGIGRQYAGNAPLVETLRDMSKWGERYYFIMPSFGSNKGITSYFSNPLPSQIRCMMHLGAAFQAKGLFFWTYQTPFPDHDAFVDPATLLPLDDKWAAAGEAAANILKNADLLTECTWGGRYGFVEGSALLEAFELRRQDDEATYFYLINKDTVRSVDARLFMLKKEYSLHNLFTDEDIPISEGTVQLIRPDLTAVGGVASVRLMPGDGVLLKYSAPVQTDDGTVVVGTLPRVVYPDKVANAPTDSIVWLADVKPVEMPVPGWFPAVKFKGKTWYPDYNAKDLLLFSGPDDTGQTYEKSLWAHAETTIKYAIPEGVTTFAAAAGFANKHEKSSAIFRVLVDGSEKYNSGVMKLGSAVQPVVVNVSGGTLLELITEEAGDGLYGDYTFWGEARLLK